MLIGVTGNPITFGKDGKTTAARFLAKEMGALYVDLMEPVRAMLRVSFQDVKLSPEDERKSLNVICALGRKNDPDYWLHLSLQSLPDKDKPGNLVFDNLFFYNEYLFVKQRGGYVIEVVRDKLNEPLDFVPDQICITGNMDESELRKTLLRTALSLKNPTP